MKKTLVFAIAMGLALSSVAFAHDLEAKVRTEGRADARIKPFSDLKALMGLKLGENKFVLNGTVKEVGSSSLTVEVRGGAHLKNVASGIAVVTVDADTKFSNGKTGIALADVKAGAHVMIKGEIEDGGGLEADHVAAVVKPQIALGEVTAKTDTSITLKNNITGESKTVTTNDDTKVVLNGEVKTMADVQVGDKGMVKFKAVVDSFVAKVIRLFR